MRGLSRRKGSGVWQGRFYIPSEIWNERDRLRELGVKVGKNQDYLKSLGERSKGDAETAYLERLRDHSNKMADWQALLSLGPVKLDHEQVVAIAGNAALEFVRQHKADPESLTAPISFIRFAFGWLEANMRQRGQFFIAMDNPVEEFLREVEALSLPALPDFIRKEREKDIGPYRAMFIDYLRRILVAYREKMGQDLIASALASHVLAVTEGSREALNKAGAVFAGRALDALEARLVEMDYTDPAWEAGVPAINLPSKTRVSGRDRSANPFDLFKLLEHKASTQTSSAKTISLYEGTVRRFKKFVGHSDASRVTKANVREWRDAMIEEGLSPATINRKHLAAIGAILGHAVEEFDLGHNVAHGIKDKREDTGPVVKKEYDREVVSDILTATFKGSEKSGLSLPHRRAIFWLPWLMTYTGLRAGEVAQIQGRSVLEHRGQPYLLITPDDGSTKSRRAWATGLHAHLLELGFLEFAKEVGDGPLFYTPYPKDMSLQGVKNPRWEQSYKRVGEWITGELGINAPLGRANHAFRHAMTTASRGGQEEEDAWERLDKETRDYMLGSRPQNDAREGYGEWGPSVLNREINKLPRFNVKDPGKRPYK
ncbi:hypothetical protein ASF70_07515 [Rhizobium sp. Leaf321]|uniref:tyrosine-type recombinase/integrase n=1 Tax=Rhizobium sp. Leaf321 TaxID=1736335 RepID=UPI000715AB60|nr:site-specific integrase [Rhizobium sp. Leaf321]KQQ73651.1 hypothetical protein ASF70_07515 [Rhizobium sp. Leaf321]